MILKTLILDNNLYQTEIKELIQAIRLFSDYAVASFRDISNEFRLTEGFDAIVLTGSEARLVKPEKSMYNNLAKMIVETEKPTMGICFGHQLGCLAFGAEIGSLAKPARNFFETVTIVETDDIFSEFKIGQPFLFAEHHDDYIKRESLDNACLKLLAYSKSCETEAVKHEVKPFYGIQFHAEEIKIGSEEHKDGLKVIENFYKIC